MCEAGSKSPSRVDTKIIEARLIEYMDDNRRLEKELKSLHIIVEAMYQDLLDVQQEREHLELHRKMLCCPVPCSDNCSTICGGPPQCDKCDRPTCETIIKDLYKKYRNLQISFKAKSIEVLDLRVENEVLKERMRQDVEAQREMECAHANTRSINFNVQPCSKSCQQFYRN